MHAAEGDREVTGMRFLSIITAAAMFVSLASAQSDRGSLTGTIADPAGGVVANAAIQVRNIENGAIYQSGTSATGNYVIPVPTGTYELTVTVQGFKKFVRQGLFVPVAQVVRVDIALEVGATTESITIEASTPLLKTESGEMSHNIEINQLDALPVLRASTSIRNPYSASTLLPGMNLTNTTTTYQNLRVNGMPSNTQAFRVDGQDSTNGLWQIQTIQVQPSVDAIQEIAVQTSNFAAEFGQAAGGVFNLTMRSGTNKLHGGAFEYMTNEALNAGLAYTSNVAGGKPNEHIRNRGRQNDYGFSLGGPVYIPKAYNGRDRTFFFFNFEQWRNNVFTSNGLYTVPTDAMRNGDFSNQGLAAPRSFTPGGDSSGLAPIIEGQIFDPTSSIGTYQSYVVRQAFPNNVIPRSMMDPLALRLQSLIPEPNTGGPNAVFQNYAVPTYSVPLVNTIPSVKIDQNLSSTMKVSGYWSTNRVDNPAATPIGNGDGLPFPISIANINKDRTHTIRLNFDDTITPTFLLHIGAGMVHVNSGQGAPTLTDSQRSSLTVPNVNNTKYLGYYSALAAGGGARGGYSQNMGPQLIRVFKNEKPSANFSLTWVHNNHTYKAGGEVIVDGYTSLVESFSNGNAAFSANETSQPFYQALVGAPFTVGHNYASFLLGAVDSGSHAGSPRSVSAESHLGSHALAFFLQDSFKVTRRLTLDYGLRYDFVTYLKEQYGRIPAWSGSTPNPHLGGLLGGVAYEGSGPGHCNCDIAHNYPYAFGPRLGVAYQINEKTVFRGGFGVQYGKTPEFGWLGGSVNGLVNFATSNPYFPQFYLSQGINVPVTYPSYDPGLFPTTPAGRETPTYVIDQNAGRPARIATWSIALQREIARNVVLEAAYVGNRGVWEQSNISQVNALTTQRLAAFGFSLDNPADLSVLSSQIGSVLGKDPRITQLPYAGFPLTGTVYSALRPYPQFNTNLQLLWSPAGKSWYDALQTKITKRYSYGLEFQGAFTWQKELQISAENSYALFGFANGAGTVQNDVTNYNQNKYLSGQSRPLQFVIASTYTTPKPKIDRIVGLVAGDWQIGAVLRYQSGALIMLPNTNNNLQNQIGRGGNLVERVPGVPIFLKDPNCGCFDPTKDLIINPAAFRQTPAGHFSSSTAYYNDFRATRFPNESMSLGRNFRFGHEGRVILNVRGEFSNIFNRRFTPAPILNTAVSATTATTLTAPTTYGPNGLLTGGFGFINTGGGVFQQPRSGQLVARVTF
jgi:hypothetical protein